MFGESFGEGDGSQSGDGGVVFGEDEEPSWLCGLEGWEGLAPFLGELFASWFALGLPFGCDFDDGVGGEGEDALGADGGVGGSGAGGHEVAVEEFGECAEVAVVAGDDEVAEFLKSTYYLPIKVYDDMNEINYLYQNCFAKLYGEDGEKLSDEKAEAYLKDSGYMNAAHILFMTVDPSTGEALDDETIAEKKALADKFAAELAGITDTEKLQERFAEIKDEYCEDTGKEAYPDGYIFTPGTMVTEFEATVNALEEYQVSEPVESRYGYHIIMRLPLTIDTVLKTSDSGTPLTARALAANQEYGEKLDACNDGIEIVYTDAFTGFGIADYIK